MSLRLHCFNPVCLLILTIVKLKCSHLNSVESLASRVNANLIWTPVLLGAIYRLTAAPQGAAGSASDIFNSAKKAITSASFNRTLKRYRIPHNASSAHLRKTTAALRLIHHLPNAERPQLTKALFRAYWVDGADVTDHKVLLDLARRSGIPSAQQLTDEVFNDTKDRKSLETATDQVIARGSPGVPAFWIEDEVWTSADGSQSQGRLYWGQDRMLFVEAVMRGLQLGKSFDQVPAIAGLHPRCVRDIPKGRVKLEFWYDFSSPWAFLGWSQLQRLKRICGDNLEIEMMPILLGALFREYVYNVPVDFSYCSLTALG
jgi:2-hydroxychromene-2-carboxylate isomerase